MYLETIQKKLDFALSLKALPTLDEQIKIGFVGLKKRYPNSYVIIREKKFYYALIHCCGMTKKSAMKMYLHEKEHMNKINSLGLRKYARFAIVVIRENEQSYFVPVIITFKPLETNQAKYVLDVSNKSEGDNLTLNRIS